MCSRIAILAALASVAASVVGAQWINYPTPGIPRTANGKPNLTAPVPKMPDGKPNLQGIWTTNSDYFKDLATNIEPDGVPMLPSAKAIVAERETNDHKGDAMAQCMPPGVPRIDTSNSGEALHPFKIVQTPALVVLLYETSSNSIFRQVFLDRRPLPTDPQPAWLGYSVGKWDGDTLVVDTIGFNGRAWLDTFKGHPQTEAGHVTERFTRRDFGHMDLQITIEDPKLYARPWTVTLPYTLLADTELIETVCENEKDTAHAAK
jgi:hypothetical protein